MAQMGDYIRSKASSFLAYAPTDKAVHRHCSNAWKFAAMGEDFHSKGDYAGANQAWSEAHPHLDAAANLAKKAASAIQGFPPSDTLNQEMGESHEEHEKYTQQINEGLKNGR